MPNQLSFDIEFTRADIQQILDNTDVTDIVVWGTYSYNPNLGQNYWEMNVQAQGTDSNKSLIGTIVLGCIKPCPNPLVSQSSNAD